MTASKTYTLEPSCRTKLEKSFDQTISEIFLLTTLLPDEDARLHPGEASLDPHINHRAVELSGKGTVVKPFVLQLLKSMVVKMSNILGENSSNKEHHHQQGSSHGGCLENND